MTQPQLKKFIIVCARDGRDEALELAREGLRRFRARH